MLNITYPTGQLPNDLRDRSHFKDGPVDIFEAAVDVHDNGNWLLNYHLSRALQSTG